MTSKRGHATLDRVGALGNILGRHQGLALLLASTGVAIDIKPPKKQPDPPGGLRPATSQLPGEVCDRRKEGLLAALREQASDHGGPQAET